jgi:transcriptional regulator with XRE-family HTH domain
MPHLPGPDVHRLVVEAQIALGLSQERLGKMLGASRRTVTRWAASQSLPSLAQLHAIARAVHPADPVLAAKIAEEGGETLESLSIVAPGSLVPAPAPRPFPPTRLVVEAVVCAVAETMQASPAAARDALRAGFARARALGLSVEEVDDALSLPVETHASKPAASGGKRAL